MTYVDSLSARSARTNRPQHPITPESVIRSVVTALAAVGIGLGISAVAMAHDVKTALTVRGLLPPGHYLVLFQNNAELRPSGGFLGTFATVDLDAWGYRSLRIDTNIYKRDNAFTEIHAIEPPAPLNGVAAQNRWAMRDSNWDLDFRDAASRVAWFYQQEGGEPVDGVIAINATVAQDLLRMTGPINLPHSTETLSADNFFDTLHYKIEKEYFYDPSNRAANEPKSVLKDLVPEVLHAASTPRMIPRLVPLLEQELTEKQIQFFHTSPEVEQRIIDRNWGGAIAETSGDYLLINNASVGGQKSSLNMVQSVELDVSTTVSGLRHVLTLERTHTGDGVWPDHTNNNYVRIAVPQNASLVEVRRNGAVVTDQVVTSLEAGKTVYGIHFDTDPGTTSQLEMTYQTGLYPPYQLLYQKQSGTLQESLRVRVGGRVEFDGLVSTDTSVSGD